ncbi:MAG TPA: hypothetical protein VFO89_08625 [Thermoanaerobaculia bacterium]|nr:hypothetical protein [Thermoanaerobaculia bacterium]
MPYTIQFVGLACFLRSSGGRTVLLPDGRDPGEGIDPHYGRIVVDPSAVVNEEGWPAGHPPGVFMLDPCTIAITAAAESGTLDTSQHDRKLPELAAANPMFRIDPAMAQTIARLDIRQGMLRAFRAPGGEATISQLDVPYDDAIRITVTPDDGGAARTIDLAPGTEIAITNIAAHGYVDRVRENGHFRIYEKLGATRVRLEAPTEVPPVPLSTTQHPCFAGILPIGLSTSCSNTGCCTP